MPTIDSLEQVYFVVGFFAPGLIVLFFRSQFLTGRTPALRDAALVYLVLSVVYYAIAYPLVDFALSIRATENQKLVGWALLILIGPMIFGIVLGLNARLDITRRLLARFGVNPVHAVPTAWDWKFSRIQPSWMLVRMKNDLKFYGFFGSNSFAASDPDERDIYLEQLYEVDKKNNWKKAPNGKGVLIRADEVNTIEFWPIENGDNDAEKRN